VDIDRDRQKQIIEVFEIWIWRRMEKISWLDKVTDRVLRRISEDRQILNFYLAKETSMDWQCFET